MATFLLAGLANTLLLLPTPYGLGGIGLLIVIVLTNVLQLGRAFHEPLYASLDQVGRLLAWLFAPAIVLDAPFVRFTNIGVVHEAMLIGPNLRPSLLCGAFLALLAILTLVVAVVDALRTALNSKPLDGKRGAEALVVARPLSTFDREQDLGVLLMQVQDLSRRITLAETTLRSVTQDEPFAPTAAIKGHCAPPSLAEPENKTNTQDDAAIMALREQGYYDGPWSEDRNEEGPETYGPISDDADFLKIMESR